MKYFKLGPKATLYVDEKNICSISGKQVVAVEDNEVGQSTSMQRAITSKHIVEADEAEFKSWEAENGVTEEAGKAEVPANVAGAKGTKGGGSEINSIGADNTNPHGNDGQSLDANEDDDDDEEEEEDDLTKTEMIDALKKSSMPTAEKNKLTSLAEPQLRVAYAKYVTK